jgi:hypothetical protein
VLTTSHQPGLGGHRQCHLRKTPEKMGVSSWVDDQEEVNVNRATGEGRKKLDEGKSDPRPQPLMRFLGSGVTGDPSLGRSKGGSIRTPRGHSRREGGKGPEGWAARRLTPGSLIMQAKAPPCRRPRPGSEESPPTLMTYQESGGVVMLIRHSWPL